MPTIETPRLRLRHWQPADYEAWATMMADPRVCEFLGGIKERGESLAQAERFASRLEENGYGWWVLEIKGGPAFAGVIILQDVPFAAHFTPALEVGWHLAFEHWKRGYATEGARAALEFAFTRLDRSEVVALTAATNVRSQRVMERLGMTRDANDDFDHPWVQPTSSLHRHVLYRHSRA